MAKLNLKYYDGNDIYNDGNVEENLLDCYKNKKAIDLSQDGVFYLTTSIRTNILNWYPFHKKDQVLEIGCGCGTLTEMLTEKCGMVTCVEGSKRRAEITYYRHHDKKNLEVYAGNFDDIILNKKFDYIILIGVFEYAKMFFEVDNPFDVFLEKIKALLNPNGKVLLAIENRYGIKYWAGANEDHLAKPYVGLEGYDSFKVQTFGKEEFIKMIEKHGFCKNKFYYPFPDYKLPSIIYTDKRLPKSNEIVDIPIYTYGNATTFDIHKVMSGLIDNSCFGFFSNSFLVEFGMEQSEMSDIIYARNLSYRCANYRTVTIENEDHKIIKIATNNESCKHLEQLMKVHERMRKLKIPACFINKEDDKYFIEKIDGYNVAEYIQVLVKEKKFDEALMEIDRLVKFYKKHSIKKKITNPIIKDVSNVYKNDTYIFKLSLIDGNASNIIRNNNGDYIFIDQEWLDEKELPTDYLIYYSISYILGTCNGLFEKYSSSMIYKRYGITDEKKTLFRKIEKNYFTEKYKVVDTKIQEILDGCSYSRLSCDELNVIYYNNGNGFNEQNKIIGKYQAVSENEYTVSYQLPKDVFEVRFDPIIIGNKLKTFSNVKVNGKSISYDEYNVWEFDGKKTLVLEHPYIVFQFSDITLNISICLEDFTDDEKKRFFQEMSMITGEKNMLKNENEKLELELQNLINSKGWKLLENSEKIRR